MVVRLFEKSEQKSVQKLETQIRSQVLEFNTRFGIQGKWQGVVAFAVVFFFLMVEEMYFKFV